MALGRKNWLHVGSAQSGPKVVAILSVIESCRRLGVPVKGYLAAVLPGMARRKTSEVSSLTPARWAAARALPGLVVRIRCSQHWSRSLAASLIQQGSRQLTNGASAGMAAMIA